MDVERVVFFGFFEISFRRSRADFCGCQEVGN